MSLKEIFSLPLLLRLGGGVGEQSMVAWMEGREGKAASLSLGRSGSWDSMTPSLALDVGYALN